MAKPKNNRRDIGGVGIATDGIEEKTVKAAKVESVAEPKKPKGSESDGRSRHRADPDLAALFIILDRAKLCQKRSCAKHACSFALTIPSCQRAASTGW